MRTVPYLPGTMAVSKTGVAMRRGCPRCVSTSSQVARQPASSYRNDPSRALSGQCDASATPVNLGARATAQDAAARHRNASPSGFRLPNLSG
jgi:hypothetical protein